MAMTLFVSSVMAAASDIPKQPTTPQAPPAVPAAPFPAQPQFGRGFGGFNPFGSHPRLGVQISKPSETLEEQLGLPKGHAFVIDQVVPDSAAAKAGVKNHDILLKVNDKPVPSEPQELTQLLSEIKPDATVDLVLMRKGKEETIKGVKLPEVKNEAPLQRFRGRPGITAPPQGFGNAPFPAFRGGPAMPQGGFGGGMGAGQHGIITTLHRTDDRFTARHQEGSLIISVTGSAGEGKFKVSSIHIQDGNQDNKYESVDKVPEEYRDKVASLVEMAKTGNIKLELRTSEERKKD
jgi:hypothetical protein